MSSPSDAAPERVLVARLAAAHGITPNRRLGQHFLLDENLVDVSVREAGVGPDDVAFEVGAGVGAATVEVGAATGAERREAPERTASQGLSCGPVSVWD
ncbi:MAG: rRNA adenine N-6-methyltransferase family protein, partial [Miltoncostaeaceae bacterium]